MTKAKRKRLIYNLVTFALVIGAYLILQNMIAEKTITRSLKGLLVPITPSRMPPSMAPGMEPIPPKTAAVKALMPGMEPVVGVRTG